MKKKEDIKADVIRADTDVIQKTQERLQDFYIAEVELRLKESGLDKQRQIQIADRLLQVFAPEKP